ncbi:flagellar biosynthetic protein FliR [Albidovulum sediminicola]|uniref:Flagellar biosynthetic protein FliR n=1 Tax=Albidovulum sediminicola TaxID=2984331 RepID=A0ABT2YW88_9RHOB|nr:flagellar biosynthetic protein FliR [Defluviimonas sp. WL0075]MCV2863129.1 flagellar biosynthetic protein FliR [Defluviimonas sp. WL0075]
MTDLLAELQRLGGGAALTAALVFARVGAAMVAMPGFSQGFVPVRIRLGAAIAFTAVILPAVQAMVTPPGQALDAAAMLLGEVVVGAVLGAFLRLFTQALEVAGMTIAQSTSLAQMFGGGGAEPLPAISHLLLMAGLALAAMAGLHLRLAEALILSYQALPAGGIPDAGVLRDWGVGGVIRAFLLAFGLAAPFLIIATLYNFALGAINRAMPQLMVMMVGAPAVTGGTLLLLGAAAPALVAVWHNAFAGILADPFAVRP